MALNGIVYEIQSKKIQLERELAIKKEAFQSGNAEDRMDYFRALHGAKKSFKDVFESCVARLAHEIYIEYLSTLDGKKEHKVDAKSAYDFFTTTHEVEFFKIKEAVEFIAIADIDSIFIESLNEVISTNGSLVKNKKRVVLTAGEKEAVSKLILKKFQSRTLKLGGLINFVFNEALCTGMATYEVIGPYQNLECRFSLRREGGELFLNGFLFN